MDWKKQSEELVAALNEAQRKMWNLCADGIKTLAAAPVDKKWVESVELTEKVMTNSLRAQAKLTAAIVERLAEADRMSESTVESTRSLQEIIENLVETQEKLIGSWFGVLKKMDPSSRVSRLTDPLQRMQDLAAKAMDTQMELLRVWSGKPAPGKKTTAGKTARKKTTKKKTAKKKTAGKSTRTQASS